MPRTVDLKSLTSSSMLLSKTRWIVIFQIVITLLYELFYLIEFSLSDDSGNLVASTLVETSRSTTSGIYISIQEKENIIDDLIYNSLVDISNETKKLLTKYMANYIL